jgi:hypothetical protein
VSEPESVQAWVEVKLALCFPSHRQEVHHRADLMEYQLEVWWSYPPCLRRCQVRIR